MAVVQAAPRNRARTVLLSALAGVLWLFGWMAGVVSLVVGKVRPGFSWMWIAIKVGWMDARTPRRR